MQEQLKQLFELAALGVEAVGVTLLLVGLLLCLGRFLGRVIRGPDRHSAYRSFRVELGRPLLLSLEFLVASDIIYTIAVERTLQTLGMLGLLVAIRTVLSFTLEVELTGHWPWQSPRVQHGERTTN